MKQSNEEMRFSFVLQDLITGKKLFVDSVTDLGNPGNETHIIVRRNGIITRHHVIVLTRKSIV